MSIYKLRFFCIFYFGVDEMNNASLASKIKALCKQHKIPIKKLLEDCNINRNFMYDLEHSGAAPAIDKLERIADYLGVSTDYLLGRTDTPVSETAPTHTIVIPARNGKTMYRQLTPEQWEKYNKLIEVAMPEILDDSDEEDF